MRAVFVASSVAEVHLNIMVVRESGVPEQALSRLALDVPVTITQAPESFAERMVPEAVSCLVVGADWQPVAQHLQQSVEAISGPFVALVPEGDVALGHFLGRMGTGSADLYQCHRRRLVYCFRCRYRCLAQYRGDEYPCE